MSSSLSRIVNSNEITGTVPIWDPQTVVKILKDLDLDKWYPLQTDVGLLFFTKTSGDFDFELHYECRGYNLVKDRIHRYELND